MRFLKLILGILAASVIVLIVLSIPLRKGYQKYYAFEQRKLREIISGTQKNDVLFIGSSRTLYHINPHIIDSVLDVRSFNAGIDGARLVEINMILKCYLAVHPKPACVVVDISTSSFDINRAPIFNPNIYYPFLENSIIYNTLKPYKRVGLLKTLPFLKVAEWDDYLKAGALKGAMGQEQPLARHYKGYLESGTDTIKLPFKKVYYTTDFPVRPEGKRLLDEIIDICRKKGIKLILTYAPVYKHEGEKLNPVFFSTLIEVSEKNKIPFLNYRYFGIKSDQTLFRDEHHLNTRGAEIYSAQLGHDLVELIK